MQFIKKTNDIFRRLSEKANSLLGDALIDFLLHRAPKPHSNVLFWGNSGNLAFTHLSAGIGFALSLRGCTPHYVVHDDKSCNGYCLESSDKQHRLTQEQCFLCRLREREILSKFGFHCCELSKFIDDNGWNLIDEFCSRVYDLVIKNTISQIANLGFIGVPEIGRDVLATIVRHYRTDDLDVVEADVAAGYARVAAVSALACMGALKLLNPSYLCNVHSSYAMVRPASRIALLNNRNYFTCQDHHFGTLCFKTIFPSDICHSSMGLSDIAWKKISKTYVDECILEKRVHDFFAHRYNNFIGGINFLKNSNIEPVKYTLKRKRNKKLFAIFTHINWDNAFGFGKTPFVSLKEWLEYTLQCISSVTDVDWIIRIHPSEHFKYNSKGVYSQFEPEFSILPPHITVIPPDSLINPLNLLKEIDGIVTCCGTSGLEAAALGKIVITGCLGYYSCRGFTIDPMQEERPVNAYAETLRNAANLPYPTKSQIELAQRFLLTYFYRRGSKKLNWLNNYGLHIEYFWQWLQFLPSHCNDIDTVCDGLLKERDVFFDQCI